MFGGLTPEQGPNTYGAIVTAFTPAANATDVLSIFQDGTRLVRVKRIRVSGIATAANTLLFQVIKRVTQNTGGTPAALTVVPYRSSQFGSVVTVNKYAANPTVGSITGAGAVKTQQLSVAPAASSSIQAGLMEIDFTLDGRELFLEGTEALCLNLGGAAVPAGLALEIDLAWTEEAKT